MPEDRDHLDPNYQNNPDFNCEEDEDDYADEICSGCSGCGEGQYDGSSCNKCHGSGIEPVKKDDEP